MGNVASPRAKMPKMVTGNIVHKRTTSLVVDLDYKLPVGSDLLFSTGESIFALNYSMCSILNIFGNRVRKMLSMKGLSESLKGLFESLFSKAFVPGHRSNSSTFWVNFLIKTSLPFWLVVCSQALTDGEPVLDPMGIRSGSSAQGVKPHRGLAPPISSTGWLMDVIR
ncbi:hypothetical protein LWI28_026985 [Acer negundo]|uniref:Uncharacterized protein n=1 Tax=Acer negundo TaxID=4023 RepID=A0AAD5IHJ3_ACENE|nr:hypothetical protein LWI28_026985 [Acer negundo]